jgi:hypothetical protein
VAGEFGDVDVRAEGDGRRWHPVTRIAIWVLWRQVGRSYPYEALLGAVEVPAGILLFVPRTATPGAPVGFASMARVLMLNMTFDVPVKILSFHLLLTRLVLSAP